MLKTMLGLEHGVIAYIIAKNNIIEILEEHGPLTIEEIAQKMTTFKLKNFELFEKILNYAISLDILKREAKT